MNKQTAENQSISVLQASGIIIGHGIGSGILSVPYLAAHCSAAEVVIILLLCAVSAVLLHLLIAELSYNNGGAQFAACFKNELFSGKLRDTLTWVAFVLMGLSVLVNVGAYLTGAAAVLQNWFEISEELGVFLFYIICSCIVFFGIRLVGLFEQYAVAAMVVVVSALLVAVLTGQKCPLPMSGTGFSGCLALFGAVSFSLSAVMSVPQVVKGLNFNAKKIRISIVLGIAVNTLIILMITLAALLGVGADLTEDGALVDLARRLGGWAKVLGYVFTLLALATSLWANTIDLRDMISEQLHWSKTISWLCATVPSLIFALLSDLGFVTLTRFAGVILVVTGLGIIIAYHRSRLRTGQSPLLGSLGTTPFQTLILISTLLATVGSVIKI